MKLLKPLGNLTQPFAVNYNNSYTASGLKGHSGEDYVVGWKKPIIASATGRVFSILNEYNPDTNKYRAVYQIVYDELKAGEKAYEVSYGHIDTALYKEGEMVYAGHNIATEGNYGLCFVGGTQVTKEQKETGLGSHLHFQVRELKIVKSKTKGKKYIRNSEGDLKIFDHYFEVIDPDNGYAGCIDPSQFYEGAVKACKLGDNNDNVKLLQQKLSKMGFFTVEPTGYYGNITRKAVFDFQLKYVPLTWYERTVLIGMYFGEKSVKAINAL